MSTDTKGVKILARSFFQNLRSQGYTPNQIIGIATELIDLVTTDLRDHSIRQAVAATTMPDVTPMPEIQPRPRPQ